VRRKRFLLVAAVAAFGVAALFGHSSGKGRRPVAAPLSWMVLAPESDPQSWRTLARIGDGLTVVSDRVGRLAIVYALYPFETHASDLIWEIITFAVIAAARLMLLRLERKALSNV